VRLTEESQNTKLLKIKHRERHADQKYREKQQKLTSELAILAQETEKFMHN
jgi:hypothetical protein